MEMLWLLNMDFKVDKDQTVPDEQKILTQVETNEKIIGTTTLEELQAALKHHKDIKAQSEAAILDLEAQIVKAQSVLALK